MLAAVTTLETYLERPFKRTIANTVFHLRSSRNNAIVLRPRRTIASHELLHELLRHKTTIAATALAESTPSPNSQSHSGTPALKTKDFSLKIGRLSKTQTWIY